MTVTLIDLQRDTGMTLKEVVRILTDISSLVDVSQRIQHLEERQVCMYHFASMDCISMQIQTGAAVSTPGY